jgi:hypothetical protein
MMNNFVEKPTFDLIKPVVERQPKQYNSKNLTGLPKPVRKYFMHVLKDGQKTIRVARIKQVGEFRTSPTQKRWIPFTAEQVFTTDRPGFEWQAKMKILPFMTLNIKDEYFQGRGSMRGKLFSKLKIMNESGQEELAQGALMRYLAEAVWFPTALLPGDTLSWHEIDSESAKVVLMDGKHKVSGNFFFNEKGEINKFVTYERFRKIKGGYQKEKFSARSYNYKEFDGIRIPTEGEAEWNLSEGDFRFIKFQITVVHFTY